MRALNLHFPLNRTPQGKKRAEKEAVSPLDRTMIHPESYGAAMKFLSIVGVRSQDIGADHFIRTVRHFMPTTSKFLVL